MKTTIKFSIESMLSKYKVKYEKIVSCVGDKRHPASMTVTNDEHGKYA